MKLLLTFLFCTITYCVHAQNPLLMPIIEEAEKGNTQAMVAIGWEYLRKEKYIEATNWLNKAAEAGDSLSYIPLGHCMYQLGKYKEALCWYEKMKDSNSDVFKDIANCYFVMKNYSMALTFLKKAPQRVDVIFGIGQCLMFLKNYTEAITYLKRAESLNYKSAYIWIGHYYFNIENYTEALSWYKKAADKGIAHAFSSIGDLYANGLGTTKDLTEAKKFYLLGIDKGDSYALGALCECLYKNKEYSEVKKWSEIAIKNEKQSFMGYRTLARLYMYGFGVKQDKNKAFYFINKAIDAAKQEGGPMPNTLDAEGELYLADNNISKAREIYNTVLKETPDFYNQNETKLSKFMKEHKGGDVDIDVPIANNVSNYTFAVIISNEKYQMEKSVQYAENDGKAFAEYCKKTLGLPEKNVRFITNATLNNIKHEIKWLQDVIAVYNGDAKVIFYYAGHGIPDEQNKSAYLLPIDGYGSDVTTGYALEDLYKALGSLPSQSVTVFLDACFSGAKRDGDMLASARGVAIKAKQSNPTGNMVVFTAAQGDEAAYPYKEEGHGLFTYYLLKKLQETKGDVTLGELGDYVKTQVERQSIVTNGKLQSPAILSASSIGNSWKEWKLNK